MGDIDDMLEDAGYKHESFEQLHGARAWVLVTIDSDGNLLSSRVINTILDKAALASVLLIEHEEMLDLLRGSDDDTTEDNI